MASICVHRAPPTPPDSTPGHIRSRDDFQEFGRPATHGPQSPVSARALAFLQFIWHGNRHSTGLQGTSARAMASICVHRAPRTPSDSTPGHIGSRDDWQEARRMTWNCHARPSEPGPTLTCNSSSKAIAVLRASRAHPLARWHRFVSIERREPLQTALQGISARAMISRKITGRPRACHARPSEPGHTLSCNSSGKAIAIPRTSRAHPPARWHRFVSIERREPLQTALQSIFRFQMEPNWAHLDLFVS